MPSFKISIDSQNHEAAYLNDTRHAFKMQLQPDKGGEGGSGIEDLLEEFIPRFTEIVEPEIDSIQKHSRDIASLASTSADSNIMLIDHVEQEEVSTFTISML